ncbi:DUF3800 domain-containing protein [Streptomyces zagrosensis]|uniref:DUF3800 domain-containing protein n=1 Tax=Streptomyces zagrosensis TaxID=1042984 RepID=A0A7W9V2J9_9ACTN|nr:DUF3800 domain-containing protein [Streptomyces zagrosensis]MBB5940398.1 hypothetical protein [Streptomyces zagrosensis]
MLVMPAAQQQARESGGAVGQLVGVASCGEDGGVIERDHAPNAGTGLLGANFSRRSRLEPTDDRAGAGRWIAIDESGYHGDQLYGGDRYMILGSVAIDDADAAAIVDTLRVEAGIQKSAAELKFQKMFAGPAAGRRRHLLGDLLAPDGPLHDRASVYVIDKHYFVAAKLVDLLLEERFNAMGIDIVMNGVARQFALDLATEGPRAMGRDGFDRLIATAVGFFSKKNRTGDHVTVDELFTVIQQCHAYARRREAPQAKKAAQVLEMLRTTRPEAEAFARERPSEATPTGEHGLLDDSTDPLVTAVPTVILHASIRHGGKLQVLADDQRLLTDDKLDVLERGATAVGLVQGLIEQSHLQNLVRGRSVDHASLQLADLVAGAGRAVARWHDGQDDAAGQDLHLVVAPLVDPNGLLMDEKPADFARVDTARAKRR